MCIAQLFPAAAHGLGIDEIGTNFAATIFTLASTLAGKLATDGLLRVVAGRLEDLLAITAVAITHHAAPDQNRIRSFCPAGRLNFSAPQKNSAAYRVSCSLYRVPANRAEVLPDRDASRADSAPDINNRLLSLGHTPPPATI